MRHFWCQDLVRKAPVLKTPQAVLRRGGRRLGRRYCQQHPRLDLSTGRNRCRQHSRLACGDRRNNHRKQCRFERRILNAVFEPAPSQPAEAAGHKLNLHCGAAYITTSRNLDQKPAAKRTIIAVLTLAYFINHHHPQQSLIRRQNKVLTIF
jgi:hypothetical protein